jgi:hypothetical protein
MQREKIVAMNALSLFISLWLNSVATCTAHTAEPDVRFYRFEISNGKCLTDEFHYPLSGESEIEGPYYRVVTDALGRSTLVAKMRDRKSMSEIKYSFAGKSQIMDGEQHFTDGVQTAEMKSKCDSEGYYISQENVYPKTGLRYITSALSRKTSDDTETRESVVAVADGKKLGRIVAVYKLPKSALISRRFYIEGADSYKESIYSGDTGLLETEHSFKSADNKLINSIKYAYDGFGELIRLDGFDASGSWYTARTFNRGLVTSEYIRSADGTRIETRASYDSSGRTKQAQQFVDDKLICTFIYDRAGDGTAKRTLALGPDGALWAEYQNQEVWAVDRVGTPRNGKPGVLQKKGDWWSKATTGWFDKIFAPSGSR